MFALVIEREPLKLEYLPAAALSWIQDVGGFAAVGLAAWLLVQLTRAPRGGRAQPRPWYFPIVLLAAIGAALSYLALLALMIPEMVRTFTSPSKMVAPPSTTVLFLRWLCLTTGGGFAIIAALLPFLGNIPGFRLRRIWALAKLSFKEAIRLKVLWVFSALIVVFLFARWFLPSDSKPEDQVRDYVDVVFLVTSFLLLVTGLLLGAFSIPADIRSQTIHTILTKPVERFEIILGRFLGYTMLMTLVLVCTTALSLLYVLRGVDVEAEQESLKARVPLYGELVFEGTPNPLRGESVGREWEYRGYISGPNPPNPTHYAIWRFLSLPSQLGDRAKDPDNERAKVRCEFTFDIFRTTKGRDNTPVACTFAFETWRFREKDRARYNDARNERRRATAPDPTEVIDRELAKEFGYYEAASVPVADFHTLAFDIPATLFENALAPDTALREELERSGQEVVPLRVRVRCEDRTQYVGMAKYDFYFRADDHQSGYDKAWFSWNFFKGATGLWFRLCIIIGLAMALSTYLSGVISALIAAFLYNAGSFQEFIQKLAYGVNFGGGPSESMVRLLKGTNQITPVDDTAIGRMAIHSDVVFRWVLRRFLNILPDVDEFVFTGYVAEGFNISPGMLLIHLIYMLGYLLPWAILAYYLLKWREVASAT